jgi:hypothetical protein
LGTTFLGVIVIFAFAGLYTYSIAYAQASYNGSSTSSSTVCLNNQPCQTIICNNNRPCLVYESPNTESPFESSFKDRLDDLEDTLDYD